MRLHRSLLGERGLERSSILEAHPLVTRHAAPSTVPGCLRSIRASGRIAAKRPHRFGCDAMMRSTLTLRRAYAGAA